MAISSPGIGSSLDVNSIITQLMALEQRPLAQLDLKEASFQATLSAYGSLKGAISAFQTSLGGLQSLSKFETPAAKVADTAIFTATAGSTAATGSYNVTVSSLARAQVLTTAGVATPATAGSTGTVTLQVGDGTVRTLDISASNNTLEGLRNAINAAGAGISAAIVNDGSATPYRLSLTATASGLDNTITINHTLSAGALKTALDGVTEAQAASDAQLTINGIAVSGSTNSVSGAIPGVTLQLAKEGSTTLGVAADVTGVQSAVQAFVKGYNDLNKTIADLTAYNPQTRQASILLGDASTISVQTQMRATLSAAIPGLTGSRTTLSQIGVTFQPDGSLALDAAKLGAALTAAPSEVAGLFAANARSDNPLLVYQRSGSASTPGNYQVHVTSAATAGAATAGTAAAATTVINGGNDGFQVRINGIASGSVQIAHGSYDAAGLAAAVQAAVRSSGTLAAAGISPTVEVAGGKLVIRSSSHGSDSTVGSIGGSAATALGFSGSESGSGSNVAGYFEDNGRISAATGSGQTLTANRGTAADGLVVRYEGTPAQLLPGATASLTLTQGYAVRLGQLAARLLDGSGPVASRTGGIDRSIADIARQRENINRRLAATEARIRAQFTALDTLVSRLSNTSNFLTQQLANLPSLNNSRN